SLLENLRYGAVESTPVPLGPVMAQTDLVSILERLPDGLQTRLGEGGGLLSAGEGQRVRLGRGVCRGAARLVILNERSRGLERDKRQTLLQNARRLWTNATLLCITHDLDQAACFDRVLVMEAGTIVETGPPQQLANCASSQFRQFLDADAA